MNFDFISWGEFFEIFTIDSYICHVVGFDVVELCPKEDVRGPDFLAAKLVYKMLSYKFRGSK